MARAAIARRCTETYVHIKLAARFCIVKFICDGCTSQARPACAEDAFTARRTYTTRSLRLHWTKFVFWHTQGVPSNRQGRNAAVYHLVVFITFTEDLALKMATKSYSKRSRKQVHGGGKPKRRERRPTWPRRNKIRGNLTRQWWCRKSTRRTAREMRRTGRGRDNDPKTPTHSVLQKNRF